MAKPFYFISGLTQHLTDGGLTSHFHTSDLRQLSNAASIYQPIASTQIILPDNARCMAVRSLLRRDGISFNVAEISNCHDASPSGGVPFVVADNAALAVAEWKPIVAWTKTNVKHSQDQSSPNAVVWSESINQALHLAELQVCFEWEENFEEYTAPRLGSATCWPLTWAVPRRHRNNALAELKVADQMLGISSPLKEAEKMLTAVSIRLKDKDGWLASTSETGPTEADCLLYGHIRAIMDTPLPRDDLRDLVKGKKILENFCTRFHDYLQAQSEGSASDSTERPPSERVVVGNGRLRTLSSEEVKLNTNRE